LHGEGLLDVNRDALIANAQHAELLAWGFKILHKAGLLNDNRTNLIANAQYARFLNLGFETLRSAGCLTQHYVGGLIANAPYAESLARGLEILHKTRLLTQPNFNQILCGKGAHAKALIQHHELRSPLSQPIFDSLMREQWESGRQAAVQLSMLNRDIARGRDEGKPKVQLTNDMVLKIASYLTPDYQNDTIATSSALQVMWKTIRVGEAKTSGRRLSAVL